MKIDVQTSDLVQLLADRLKEDAKGRQIKLFFSGKEMLHDKPIGVYSTSNSVVTVFYKGLTTSA